MPVMPDRADGVATSEGVTAPPLYREIADDIARQIAAGLLRPGDLLPSQQDLATRWECSLQPVKRALLELEHRGLIVNRAGRRAAVAKPGE